MRLWKRAVSGKKARPLPQQHEIHCRCLSLCLFAILPDCVCDMTIKWIGAQAVSECRARKSRRRPGSSQKEGGRWTSRWPWQVKLAESLSSEWKRDAASFCCTHNDCSLAEKRRIAERPPNIGNRLWQVNDDKRSEHRQRKTTWPID